MSAAMPLAVVRSARLPMQYLQAVTAIQECIEIDDAIQWSSKADALAAWAKIYSDDKVGVEAHRLKLHAFRRMGILADEIAVSSHRPHNGGKPIKAAGVLRSHGMNGSKARYAAAIGALPQETFDRGVSAPTPPTLHDLSRVGATWASPAVRVKRALSNFRSEIARHHPKEIAMAFSAEDRARVRLWNTDIAEWLEAFQKALGL